MLSIKHWLLELTCHYLVSTAGLDIVTTIAAIPTYKPSENIRQYNDFAELIGDGRAKTARAIWNKPLKTVYISDCGELKVAKPTLSPSLPWYVQVPHFYFHIHIVTITCKGFSFLHVTLTEEDLHNAELLSWEVHICSGCQIRKRNNGLSFNTHTHTQSLCHLLREQVPKKLFCVSSSYTSYHARIDRKDFDSPP